MISKRNKNKSKRNRKKLISLLYIQLNKIYLKMLLIKKLL